MEFPRAWVGQRVPSLHAMVASIDNVMGLYKRLSEGTSASLAECSSNKSEEINQSRSLIT